MSELDHSITVTDNAAAHRFEAVVDGQLSVAEYVRDRDVVIFTHTEVPKALEGRGIANALARTALDAARAEGVRVVPSCPFFGAYIRRHPEYQPLLHSRE